MRQHVHEHTPDHEDTHFDGTRHGHPHIHQHVHQHDRIEGMQFRAWTRSGLADGLIPRGRLD